MDGGRVFVLKTAACVWMRAHECACADAHAEQSCLTVGLLHIIDDSSLRGQGDLMHWKWDLSQNYL